MTERKYALRFSDASYGPLVDHNTAVKAHEGIDPERRQLAEVTCWERVTDERAETLRPEARAEPPQKLLTNCAKCLECGDVIESKHEHDFISCKCGNLSVDGGLDYLRRAFNSERWEEMSTYQYPLKRREPPPADPFDAPDPFAVPRGELETIRKGDE